MMKIPPLAAGEVQKMKKIIVITMVSLLLLGSIPVFSMSNNDPLAKKGYTRDDVVALAKNEGEVAANPRSCLWETVGCLLPVLGPLMSCFILPPIPEDRLVGKSSAYVQAYIDGYQSQARWDQFMASANGCEIWAALGILYLGLKFFVK